MSWPSDEVEYINPRLSFKGGSKLTTREREKLLKSARKLGKVLGAAPPPHYLKKQPSCSPPLASRSTASKLTLTSALTSVPSPSTSSSAPSSASTSSDTFVTAPYSPSTSVAASSSCDTVSTSNLTVLPLMRPLTAPASTNADAQRMFPRSIPPIIIPGFKLSDLSGEHSSLPRRMRMHRKGLSTSVFDLAHRHLSHHNITSRPRPLPPVPSPQHSYPAYPNSTRPLPPTPPETSVQTPPSTRPLSMISTSTLATSIMEPRSPLSPISPVLPSPAEIHRRRVAKMAKLTRHLGEKPPHELVFRSDLCLERKDEEIEIEGDNGGGESWIHIAATSIKRSASLGRPLRSKRPLIANRPSMSSRPSLTMDPVSTLQDVGARWVKEVGSSREVVEDYGNVVKTLRELR